MTTRSDARGSFGFAAVPQGSVELELRRCVAVRGRFAPWPPCSFTSEAPREVRAGTIGSGARWFDGCDLKAPLDGDGRFELLLPEFASYSLALAAGLAARDHRVWLDRPDGRIEVTRIERAAIVSGRMPVTLTLPANWNE